MRVLLIIISFLFVGGKCHSQKEDYNWYIGRHSTLDQSFYRQGIEIFDFNNDPVTITESDSIKLCFNWTNTILSDSDGDFQIVSNGMHILGKNHLPIKGGEEINKNNYFDVRVSTYADGSIRYEGLRMPQGMIMLPWPEKDSIFYATFNVQYIDGSVLRDYCKGLFAGTIDNSKDNPKVTQKDYLITEDSLSPSSLQACRHANGRDWWIVATGHFHNKMYIFLLEPKGIRLYNIQPINNYFPMGVGQACFSPDGSKYALYETVQGYWQQGHIMILDFDRAKGVFSDLRKSTFTGISFVVGCAISFDSRYLYTANSDYLYQYDLNNSNILNTKKLITTSDGFKSVLGNGYFEANDFGYLQLAPDGKIYGPGGNTTHMHRIEYPDEKEKECTVNQHVIETVYNINTIPNLANFRLGPLDGSPADTLGIDNHPVAKFRYEQDTINHLNVRFTDLSYYRPETWHWDFDDGTTFEGKKPYWHEFPKNGTYNVCLTVSNENSEHTMCRVVTIGSTSSEELKMKNEKLVSLFPNPTEGEVLLTVSDYIPEHGEVYFYDMMGKLVHKQRVYYGWNNVNLNDINTGNYIYEVKDGSRVIGSGKIIRI